MSNTQREEEAYLITNYRIIIPIGAATRGTITRREGINRKAQFVWSHEEEGVATDWPPNNPPIPSHPTRAIAILTRRGLHPGPERRNHILRSPPRCLCAGCLPACRSQSQSAPVAFVRVRPSVRPSAHTRRSFEAAPQCHKYRENRFLSLPRHRIGDFGVAGRTDTGRESDLQFDICGEQFMPGHSYSWVFRCL